MAKGPTPGGVARYLRQQGELGGSQLFLEDLTRKEALDLAVRGKRRDFMLGVFDASHVIVKGLDFHGSAMRVEDSVNSRIEDCNFRFSSSNKFTVGNFDMPVTTRIANKNEGDRLFGNALVNCSFSYLDGNAFEGRSTGLVIDNVRIFRTQQTTLGLDSRST